MNAGKTKVMRCQVSVECHNWVHKKCCCTKLKNNIDFHCKRCLESSPSPDQSVLLREVEIKPNVKLEYVSRFCYLGDALSAGGGVEETAARARVRCAWAKFKELSSILIVHGASYLIKGKTWCIISYKGQDIRSMFPERVNLWD